MGSYPYKRHPMSDQQLVRYARKQRRASLLKAMAIAVGAAVALVVLAAGAYYLWFTASLDGALDRNRNDRAFEALSEPIDGAPFYMLILGSDQRVDEHDPDADQRTDVIVLARVDAKARQVTMLSVPRDTAYYLDDGSVVKMNELFNIGGVQKTITGVAELTGVPISHYVLVYMSDCKDIVDELGGVEIDVKSEVNNLDPKTNENVNVQPGLQVLDGREAQAYAISRHDLEGNQDARRQDKVRELIGAVIAKVLDRPVADIPAVVVSLAKYVETDLRAQELISLALDFARGSGGMTIYQASGPSDGGLREDVGMWLCYDDPEGWAEVMSVIDEGGDPSTVEYGTSDAG